MTLYEISDGFRTLYDQLDDMIEDEELTDEQREDMQQAWFDTLEGIEAEFEEKAENVACFIKVLKAEAEMMAAEEKVLAARRRSREKRIESLKNYLLGRMDDIHLKKIDRPKARISTRNNAESVAIEDPHAFILWAQEHNGSLLKYKEPEINKIEVKQALQEGGCLPHCHLQRTRSVIIK